MFTSRDSLARLLGYALLAAAAAGVLLFAAFVAGEIARPDRTVRVDFPEIATLAEGDPVVEKGVVVGKVRRIRLAPAPARAVVELELFHHRFLPRDTRFVNFSHSLMGARKVWVEPGESREPLDETALQPGVFAPGLAETLHKVDALTARVAALRAQTERLLVGENPVLAPMEAQQKLEAAARALDGLSDRLGAAQAALSSGLSQARTFAETIDRGATRTEPRLDATWSRAGELLRAIGRVQGDLDTVVSRAERLAAMAGDSAGAGRLLHDETAYERLRQSVRVLEAATRLLQEEGLSDSIKFRPRLRG